MASRNKSTKKIAIIGAGITGLASAYLLADKGYNVTIFEREQGSGGLASSASVNGVPIEKFYHHFFASDTELLSLVQELGVDNSISFYPSTVGMYMQNKLYPFTTPLDLLSFSPLPLYDRILMGLVTLYFIKRSHWKGLEKWTIQEFFSKLHAQKLYSVVWKPLLTMKFGAHADNIPATFLWGRINPRGRSRKGMGEKLGYFKNGFHTFFDALEKAVREKGVAIRYENIEAFSSTPSGVRVKTNEHSYNYDKLVFTGSNTVLRKLYSNIPPKLDSTLQKIEYQAINCMILELSESVSPYYWLNALDEHISFIGCIEHTNLVPSSHYKGSRVMYIFNYLSPSDPIYTMSEQEVYNLYTKDLKKIFPHFSKRMVKSWQLARNPFATPIYSGLYSKRMPKHAIGPNVFLANTSQVYPEDRNVNNGIVLARKIANLLAK